MPPRMTGAAQAPEPEPISTGTATIAAPAPRSAAAEAIVAPGPPAVFTALTGTAVAASGAGEASDRHAASVPPPVAETGMPLPEVSAKGGASAAAADPPTAPPGVTRVPVLPAEHLALGGAVPPAMHSLASSPPTRVESEPQVSGHAVEASEPAPGPVRPTLVLPPPAHAEPPTTREQPRQVALLPSLDASDVRRAVEARLDAFPCSDLEVQVNDDLTARLSGRVASATDRQRLVLEAQGKGALSVDDRAVEIVGEPFCRVLDQLAHASKPDVAPVIALNHKDGIYHDADPLVVTVRVPADIRTAYLHVLYLDGQGEVVHMLPNRYDWQTAVSGGEQRRIGVDVADRRQGVRDFRIAPPFGDAMIVAILSPSPLDDLGTSEVEAVPHLVTELGSDLAGARSLGGIRYAWLQIEIRPR